MEDLKKVLLLASENGNVDEVTDCVRKGVTINAKLSINGVFCTCKETALMAAAKNDHIQCVNKILQLGADVYSKLDPSYGDDDLKNAMVCAASNGHLECLQVLGEYRLPKGDTIASPYPELICAAKHGDFDSIGILLPSLEDENISKGWKGHSLMNLFLLYRCPPWCLQIMVYHGIGINGWDLNGLTPLMCAVLAENIACVQFLLQNGANVGYTDSVGSFEENGLVERHFWNDYSGRLALMYAAQVGNIHILELLLQYSRDFIDYSDPYLACTPIMFAASMGNTEAVSLFLKFGADVDYRFTLHGITPIHFAVNSGNVECFELLLKNCNEETAIKVFLYVLDHENPQMFSLFLKYHNKPDLVDSFDYSMLMKATMFEYLEAADILLQSGHLVNFQNCEGETALLTACWYGSDKSVEWLIENGANVNSQNGKGYTALMNAAHYDDRRNSNHVRCLQLLMESQANLDLVGSNGDTLFTAALTGNRICLEFLLSSGVLLDGSKKLKHLHAHAVKSVEAHIGFPLGNILLLIQHNIFDWEWCLHDLNTVVFAAMTAGISPGKFGLNNVTISPIILAFMEKDQHTLKYMIANLYFFPEDYKYISHFVAMDDYVSTDDTPDFRTVVGLFVSQPLSLQTWSFLTISRSISLTACLTDRSVRVDSLPLPEELKMKLKFKTYLSSLCYSYWRRVECEKGNKQLANWIFDRNSFWNHSNSVTKCTDKLCTCEGIGQS